MKNNNYRMNGTFDLLGQAICFLHLIFCYYFCFKITTEGPDWSGRNTLFGLIRGEDTFQSVQ